MTPLEAIIAERMSRDELIELASVSIRYARAADRSATHTIGAAESHRRMTEATARDNELRRLVRRIVRHESKEAA